MFELPLNPTDQSVPLNHSLAKALRENRGVRADSPELERLPVAGPVVSATGKAWVTDNRMGFETITFDPTWVASELFSRIVKGSNALDVGSGFGASTSAMLNRGAEVIANDISLGHLLWTRNRIDLSQRERLYLNTAAFPHLDLTEKSLDVVLLHRVLHFLSGAEIQAGLDNCHRWMKDGATLGIVIMSASHARFRDSFFPIYNERVARGEKWPGEWLDVETYLPEQAFALPPRLHPMERDELATAVERAGFTVERVDYVSLARFGRDSDGRDGTEAVGLIAHA